jgi:hypothetical protein
MKSVYLLRSLTLVVLCTFSLRVNAQAEVANLTSPFWRINGNNGTTSPTSAIGVAVNNNFIGTIDNKDFVLTTNSLERLRVSSTGNVGIGVLVPLRKLHIAGLTSGVRIEGLATGGTFITAPSATTDKLVFADANGDLRAIATGTNGQTLQVVGGIPQWTSGLVGPTGPQGLAGTNGTNGLDGAVGLVGPQGAVGPVGPQGAVGPVGPQGAVGPAGPQGPIGPTGLTGVTGPTGPNWPSFQYNQTASITVNNTTFQALPGLNATFTLATPSKVFVTTDGGFQTLSASSSGCSLIDVVVILDGNFIADGGYKRISACNTSTLTGNFASWSMSCFATNTSGNYILPAGTHTIEVQARRVGGSNAVVGGDNTTVLQGLVQLFIVTP